MIQTAIAAFIGCFAAMATLAETGAIANKIVRYLAVLLVGLVVTVVLAMLFGWVSAHVFH